MKRIEPDNPRGPMSRGLALLAGLMLSVPVQAGVDVSPGTGVGIRDNSPALVAYTDARIVVRAGRVIESGTLVVRDGVIMAVGAGVAVPDGAERVDLSGRTVYPGLVELISGIGLPTAEEAGDPRGPRHPNSGVRAERSAAAAFEPDAEAAGKLRENGFTTAVTAFQDGIFRGESAAVNLGEGGAGDVLLADSVAQHVMLSPNPFVWGSDEAPAYPAALMGAIALVRQTFMDASWYQDANDYWSRRREGERVQFNPALEALSAAAAGRQPVMMEVGDELSLRRALAIRDELGLDMILVGTGHEYRQASVLAESGATVIVPLGFPAAPAVEDPDGALDVSLETLEHWELAPMNLAVAADAGVPFAITSRGSEGFWGELRSAVKAGLDADRALAALTTVPAQLAGVYDRVGSLETGKLAHMVIADGDLFADGTIQAVVVEGHRFETAAWPSDEPTGVWSVAYQGGSGPIDWTIAGGPGAYTLSSDVGDAAIQVAGDDVHIFAEAAQFGGGEGHARLDGRLIDGERLIGSVALPDGTDFTFTASRTGDAPSEDGEADAESATEAAEQRAAAMARYPAGAYGMQDLPEQQTVLVRNATIWTSGPDGVLEGADMLVEDGEIVAIGRGLEAPSGAMVIDATGAHVSPGLIDAHSHTGISGGVNEPTDSVTVEVRVADVVDPTDIGFYRQLAGGLTAANQMHGSANTMGGQTNVVKLRWGGDAQTLGMEEGQKGVKFALGENVKQSNWGDDFTTRYPQTRMGVPEIMHDAFTAAAEYREARASRSGPPVRRDLRLEAALEILEGERKVHIHSYRQDEMLKFARLAEQYGLDVAAFQHVLEGYKVADDIAGIDAGASTFSDWWAYKYEVVDAIPYNGALMWENGVLVSFNSDSSELARRMNTEAAKAVRYGGVPPAEALKFVTLNPAIQLGMGDRTGSLEVGKDADFVIWSANPLSTYAVAEQTWVDGRRYFDRDTDLTHRERIRAERERLIAKALPERLAEMKVKVPSADDAEAGVEHLHGHRAQVAQRLYHDGHDLHSCKLEEAH